MTLRKIAEPTHPDTYGAQRCYHPSHNIPNMVALSPGTYEHRCDGCGKVSVFTIAASLWLSSEVVTADKTFRASTDDFKIEPCGCGRPEGCYGCMHR